MATNFAGLGSGLDLNTIISQLVQVERQPITRIKSRQDLVRKQISALEGISARVSILATASSALANPSRWGGVKVASSDTSVATVSSAGTGSSGTLAFSVTSLASSHALRSSGTLASTSDAATSSSRLILGTGLSQAGVSSLRTSDTIDSGSVSFAVTRSSSAAVRSGTPLPGLVTIDPTNDTFFVDVNGVPRAITLAHGTYDRNALASALNAAFTTAGVPATAAIADDSSLTLSTALEGSSASIQVTGGTALTALGLSIDATAATGTDALVSFRGVETTVTAAQAGSTITLDAPSGSTVQAVLSGGLRAHSATVAVVDTGSKSLRAVVDAVNASRATSGVTAAAVRVGTNAYRLQLSATATGADATLNVDTASLSAIGSFTQSSQAANASITIGSGEGAYEVTSSSNTFSELLPGISVTVMKPGSTTVTATPNTRSDDIKDFVQKANTALSFIADQTRASTTAAGVLSGDASVRTFATTLRNSIIGSLSTRAGISVDRTGVITFDAAAYDAAYAADPDAVRDIFSQSVSAPTGVTLSQASDSTIAGSYALTVSQAATKASVNIASWASAMSFTQGSTTASYAPAASATASEVATGLNAAFSSSQLSLEASVESGAVVVRSTAWGTLGSFAYTQGATTTNATGVNVAGTIDGVAATGLGQVLSLATTASSPAAGLRLLVDTTSTGALGNVTYATGVAGRVRQVGRDSADSASLLYAARSTREARIKSFDTQMAAMERRVKAKEEQFRRQYSAMDSTIGRLQNVSSWLAQQVNSMQANK